jgi:serpin B
MELVRSELPRATGTAGAQDGAVTAVSAFTSSLYSTLAQSRSGDENLVCSPYSVEVALGMTLQGAKGPTARQMLDVLAAGDAQTLADGLNALSQTLASRSKVLPAAEGEKPQRVELASANSLWGQRGLAWQQPFLDVLARDFGTGMRVVDYQTAAEPARVAINAWVSEQTRSRIPHLVPRGAIDESTRLTLANALYLKAPWQTPFEPGDTQDAPFHLLGGTTVTVPMMRATLSATLASGQGWVAAGLPYAGGDLSMVVVVPDTGRFAEVETSLAGDGLGRLLAGLQPDRVEIGLPRWTTRTQAELGPALSRLGMPLAFTADADFTGMTTSDRLSIAAVLHEGFIAVDEAGTEAAAATAVMMRASGFAGQPRQVIADRPFLYVIHDVATRTPLFIGRVMDPSAGA